MDALVHKVCDAHPESDGVGPLITRLDGDWGYCAGNGDGGHRWRAIKPVSRSELEQTLRQRREQLRQK
jgi:hypothetical protein